MMRNNLAIVILTLVVPLQADGKMSAARIAGASAGCARQLANPPKAPTPLPAPKKKEQKEKRGKERK